MDRVSLGKKKKKKGKKTKNERLVFAKRNSSDAWNLCVMFKGEGKEEDAMVSV